MISYSSLEYQKTSRISSSYMSNSTTLVDSGWNPTLCRRLIRRGGGSTTLPSLTQNDDVVVTSSGNIGWLLSVLLLCNISPLLSLPPCRNQVINHKNVQAKLVDWIVVAALNCTSPTAVSFGSLSEMSFAFFRERERAEKVVMLGRSSFCLSRRICECLLGVETHRGQEGNNVYVCGLHFDVGERKGYSTKYE